MANVNGSSQPQSRFQEFLGSVPLVTLLILIICVGVYIIANLLEWGDVVMALRLSPYLVVYRFELYRIVTAAFMHGGILHIAMNMMSLVALGQSLEPMFGSLRFFFLMVLYTLLIGTMYVGTAFVWAAISVAIWGPSIPGGAYPEPVIMQGAVGFSGVLFAMAVDETALSPYPTRSVFGLFNVPTRLYPWILMAVIQFIIPGVSFLGHLMGLIVGVLHSAGALDWALPTMVTLRAVENVGCMRPLFRSRPYKLVPQQEVLRSSETGLRATAGMLGGAVAFALRPVTDCFRSALGRAGSTVAGATGGAQAATSRRVDDSGRLGRAAAPAAAAAGNVTDAESPADAPAGGLWDRAGSVLAGGSTGANGSYLRVASDEDYPATGGAAGGAGVHPSAPPAQAGSAAPGAVQQAVASPVDPAKAAAREKAARAAEARLAAAAAMGRPNAGADSPRDGR